MQQLPPAEATLPATLGIEGYVREGEELARARMTVTDAVRQPFGNVHGGALAALAETIASRATSEAVGPEMVAMGQTNETTFLRPISDGVVEGVARARHRGRTSWVWDVDLTDAEGRLCAVTRMVIAVRPMPEGGP